MTEPKTKLPTASGTSVRMKIQPRPRWVFAYSDWTDLIEKNPRMRRYCQTSRTRAPNPWSVAGGDHPRPASDDGFALLPSIHVALYRPLEPRRDGAALQLRRRRRARRP